MLGFTNFLKPGEAFQNPWHQEADIKHVSRSGPTDIRPTNKNAVATATWRPRFVHPWYKVQFIAQSSCNPPAVLFKFEALRLRGKWLSYKLRVSILAKTSALKIFRYINYLTAYQSDVSRNACIMLSCEIVVSFTTFEVKPKYFKIPTLTCTCSFVIVP
jgi:hypothetical protein